MSKNVRFRQKSINPSTWFNVVGLIKNRSINTFDYKAILSFFKQCLLLSLDPALKITTDHI